MGRVQNEYKIHAGPTSPRYVSLTIDVAGIDDASVAALKRKVEEFAAEVCAEYGSLPHEVKVT